MDWGENSQVKDFLVSEIGSFFKLSNETIPFDLSDNITMKNMLVDSINPFVLLAKTSASSADNPTWEQAMKGPFAEAIGKQQRWKSKLLRRLELGLLLSEMKLKIFCLEHGLSSASDILMDQSRSSRQDSVL